MKNLCEVNVNKGDKQLELIPDDFKLSGTEFTHVFRAMMDSGAIAAMSGSALKVYIIIKILSGFDDGKTTASSVQIGEKTGLSRAQVTRGIKELKKQGLLFSERFGRRNTYRIIEKIPAIHRSGIPEAMTEIHYSKRSIQKLVGSLRSQIVEKMKGMTINGDINIQINFNHTDTINLNTDHEDINSVEADYSLVDKHGNPFDEVRAKIHS